MDSPVIRNFMRQQGFEREGAAECQMHFAALSFQPRVLGVLVLVGIALQLPAYFFVLAAILWWNVRFPMESFRLFITARLPHRWKATAMGRRIATFSRWRAGLLQGWMMTAWVVEAWWWRRGSSDLWEILSGIYIFHLIRGKVAFANATLPWKHSDS
jgi:hypothetical protein